MYRVMSEIKMIEEDILLARQVLRNGIETLRTISGDVLSGESENGTELIIQEELEESINSLDELVDLHKNLEQLSQIQ